ncbi:MAG: hypothetical protein QOC92_3996, partial [Acidimicrobiaceae bacterium]
TAAITKPQDRASLMTIAGVQARHRTLLGLVFGGQTVDDLFPTSFAKGDNPLPPDAILS